jgi:phage head maturation protease
MPRHSALLLRDNQVILEVRDAIPRPSSFNAERNTVEAVIASSHPVPRQDARGAYHEILDPTGLDVTGSIGASVLDSHRQGGVDAIIGTLDEVRVAGDEVIGLIRFSSRPEVAPIIEDVRAGIISHVSVGYQIDEVRDGTAGAGMRTKTATKWTIREVSFVSVPADPHARTRSLDEPILTRARSIRQLGRQAGAPVYVIDDMIDRGMSVEQARNHLMFDLVTRGRTEIRTTVYNTQSMDNAEAFQRAAADGLYTRMVPSFRPSPEARQFVGMSCADIAKECLCRVGINITGLAAHALITRALQTTSDYPAVLANLLNKSLRESYTQTPSGIRRLARETSAPDFRAKSRIMLDSSGFTLDKVLESGEYRYGSFVDAKESYSVDTFGKIFAISRKALINDDLGAFADITRRLGTAAAVFETQFLVNLLVANAGVGPTMDDGNPLFHTAHGNISTGGAAPSETTLSNARLAMRKQTGGGGGLISVTPAYVVVPSELETSTEKLLSSIAPIKTDDVNVFSNLQMLVEPRLSASSATRWYVAADPAQIDGLEFSYLAGQPGPQTETQVGFDIDGVKVKVRLDYGAGFVDWRGWQTNAGQ